MDSLPALLKGLVIGFSIAAPVGPIGLLCIRRTLADGPAHGFVSGLGAASADAVYGAIAGFGVALVTDALIGSQVALKLVGGLMLLWLGWNTLRARPADQSVDRPAEVRRAAGLVGAYASTFLLTLANPATILSFAAVFGGLGLSPASGGNGAGGDSTAVAAVLVLGVFVGSALWWFALSASVGAFRRRVTPAAMLWINRASGAVLGGFGIAALASLL